MRHSHIFKIFLKCKKTQNHVFRFALKSVRLEVWARELERIIAAEARSRTKNPEKNLRIFGPKSDGENHDFFDFGRGSSIL